MVLLWQYRKGYLHGADIMITTIEELLQKKEIAKKDTIYSLVEEEINCFPVTAGGFFRIEDAGRWQGDFWIDELYEQKMREKEKDSAYQGLLAQLEEIRNQIVKIKVEDPKGYAHMIQLHELRFVKHSIEKAMENLRSFYQTEVEQELEKEYQICNRRVLTYKNTVSFGSFQDVERQVAAFGKVKLAWLRKQPLLLRNISAIRKAADERAPIGLVGGPCLFGVKEVEILVNHFDGSCFCYDFSSGHHYERVGNTHISFADHVEKHLKEIESVHFRNWKKGVTSQEYESLEVLFAVGEALKAKVAIPIPDISYIKYLATVIAPLDRAIREQAIEEFRILAHKIADFFLERIEELKRKYPDVEIRVLQERDKEACEEFHAKREAFFQKSSLIHRLTAKREKTDAVFDYISMLALPYYFWGTSYVIQIDNLDETDSYRKCRKVHKNAFSLSAILYSERISANGKDTIFNAPLEYKDYI